MCSVLFFTLFGLEYKEDLCLVHACSFEFMNFIRIDSNSVVKGNNGFNFDSIQIFFFAPTFFVERFTERSKD